MKHDKAWNFIPLIHSMSPLDSVDPKKIEIENLPGIEKYKGIRLLPVGEPNLVIKKGRVRELGPNVCIGGHRSKIRGTVIVTEQGAVGLNALPTEMHVVSARAVHD